MIRLLRDSRRPIFGLLLALTIASLDSRSAGAVEIEPGRTYSGGTSLTASDVGITTSVPTGWQAGLPAGAEALVMERADQAAYIFILAEETTEAEARSAMSTEIDLGDGIKLHPLAQPTRESPELLTGTYRVSGTPRTAKGVVYTRIGSTGLGVAFFAIDMGGDDGARDAARELASRVQFAPPTTVAPANSSGGTAPWQDYMRGRYIAYFFTGSGYHEKSEIWLCSDGSFQRSSDGGGFGGGASGAYAGSGQGRWSASGTQPAKGELRLQFSDGVSSYTLALEGGDLYLDGSKWLRGDNEYCR
jgi:hypothetical protein